MTQPSSDLPQLLKTLNPQLNEGVIQNQKANTFQPLLNRQMRWILQDLPP